MPLPDAETQFDAALSLYGSGRYPEAACLAAEAAGLGAGTVWEGRALFLAARAYAEADDTEDAVRYAALASKRHGVLGDYALKLLAELHYGQKLYAEAAEQSLAVESGYPDSPLVPGSLLMAGKALVEAGRYEEASGPLARRMGMRPSDGRAEAMYQMMRVYAGLGEPGSAYALYHELWYGRPASQPARDARALMDELIEAGFAAPQEPPADALTRADNMRGAGAYKSAAREYERAATLFVDGSDEKGRALLGIGVSMYHLRENAAAARTLSALITDGRYGAHAPEAYYYLARTHLRTGDDASFRLAARGCASSYPGTSRAADCLLLLGAEAIYERDYDYALTALDELVKDYPASGLVPDALWRMGWALFGKGEHGPASSVFKDVAAGYQDTSQAAQAIYWRGRALAAAGDEAGARALYAELGRDYRLSYYAFAASLPGGVFRAGYTPREAPPQDPGPASFGGDKPLVRAFELGLLGMDREGVAELARAEARYDGGLTALMTINSAYEALGERRRPLEMASRLYRTRMRSGRSPIPDEAMRIIFPAGYWDVIASEAEAFKVDPLLVASLIREESHFDPEAVSPAGAVGLMQLMPATAAAVCRKLGIPEPGEGQLKAGGYNVPLGACHLGYLLEKHEGRVVYALAEYNAGPAALARWAARSQGAPDDVFVEDIGYPETRNYVKRVLRNYYVYSELRGGGGRTNSGP